MDQFNWPVILAVFAVLLVLRWRKASMLTWFAAWWLGMFAIVRFGFVVPVPVSVVKLYMGLVTGVLIVYILTDAGRIRQVTEPIAAFMTERRYLPYLAAVALLIPAAVAFGIYRDMTRAPLPPSFARTVHPATPSEPIDVLGTSYDLGTADNPYRRLEESDPEAFAARLEAGRAIYYENCFYCHGDVMAGEGMFAHALNPIPTSFQDPGTIAMLREAFLFWRIAKGGPGLPAEGGPWASAMPAWENFLSEEEMWNVILFLYEFTDHRPRAVELH